MYVWQRLPDLEVLRASQNSARRPLGQFTAVVLQLRGEYRTTLGVQLLTPLHATSLPSNTSLRKQETNKSKHYQSLSDIKALRKSQIQGSIRKVLLAESMNFKTETAQ